MKKVLKVSCKYSQKGSQKMVEKVIRVGLQSKYSGPSPAFVDCQKDSQTTVRNGTHVKPVLLAVKIFAVQINGSYIKIIFELLQITGKNSIVRTFENKGGGHPEN